MGMRGKKEGRMGDVNDKREDKDIGSEKLIKLKKVQKNKGV